jgi:hypothetical protein
VPRQEEEVDKGNTFRNAASSWQQREKAEETASVTAKPQSPVPTRRIGNLLSRKTADEWEDPDELIADFLKSPAMAAIPDSVSPADDEPMPPPPPRESSKDYMREFAATDRKFHK